MTQRNDLLSRLLALPPIALAYRTVVTRLARMA